MNNKIIIGVVALLAVIGIVFFVVQGDDSDTTANNEANQSESTQSPDQISASNATEASENPFLPTTGESFIATATIEDPTQGTITSVIEYDGDSVWHYAAEIGGQRQEIIATDTTLYTLDPTSGTWFAYGTDASSANFFEPDAYDYDGEELSSFKDLATYQGQEQCTNGPCDVWIANQFEGQEMFTIAFDRASGRVARVSSTSGGVSSVIDYTYTDVNIEIPTNVETIDIPSLP